jgi:hypothetical protein
LLIRAFLASIGKTLSQIVEDCRAQTVVRVDRLVQEQRQAIATPILLSSFRTVTQIGNFAERLQEAVESLYGEEAFSDYPIERLDFGKISEDLSILRDEMLGRLASAAIISFVSSKLKHDGILPDYFGHCYFMLAEECYDALSENNTDKFERVYPAFFSLGQVAFQKFDAEKHKYNQEYHVALLASVAEDLLAIGGYAYLYSEFFNDATSRDVVDRSWLALLDTVADRQAYLRWLIAASDYLTSVWSFRPRDLIRTRWDMKFESILDEAGFGDGMIGRRGRKTHPSALVRSVGGLGFNKASQVIVGLFMVEKVEGDFVLPRATENFLSTFRRERERK